MNQTYFVKTFMNGSLILTKLQTRQSLQNEYATMFSPAEFDMKLATLSESSAPIEVHFRKNGVPGTKLISLIP